MNLGAESFFSLLYGTAQAQTPRPYIAKIRKFTRHGTAVVDTPDGRKLEIESSKGWKVGDQVTIVHTSINPVGISR